MRNQSGRIVFGGYRENDDDGLPNRLGVPTIASSYRPRHLTRVRIRIVPNHRQPRNEPRLPRERVLIDQVMPGPYA